MGSGNEWADTGAAVMRCPKITAALHAVMEKCSYVQKGGHNKFHNYRYAGEADLLAVLRPAMVEAGLLLIPSVTESVGPDEHGNTTVKIAYTLAHKDGEVWPFPIFAMGCGNDKNSKGGIGDKGTYKAITGANKYLLFKLFQIETGDDPETDERDVEPPQRSQAAANRAQTKSEPSPVNPLLIPVPMLANDAGTDWNAWRFLMTKAIDNAPTLELLNDTLKANKAALSGLEAADKPAHESLKDRAAKKRSVFQGVPSQAAE